jgi:hypothetical protein
MSAPALATRAAGAEALTTRVETCSWDRPGRNPYMGDVIAAVDHYPEIAPDVRTRLKQRMARRDYDDLVVIRRDGITGQATYGGTIRDMHFGTHQVCGTVSRSGWSAQMQERALAYCEGTECILVPTVCRNVSRITRAQVAHGRAEGEAPEEVQVATAPAPVVFGLPLDGPAFELDPEPESPVPLDVGTDSDGPSGPLVVGTVGGPGGASGPSGPGPSPGIVAAVPEPETWGLLLAGMAALALRRTRRTGAAT